jgi:arsenate reductase
MADPVVIYTLASCDTCRNAIKWLRGRGLPFVEKSIRETPPSVSELQTMLRFQQGELRRLFNTAGRDYRALGLAEKIAAFSENEALALLASNGNLIKRPFLLAKERGLLGFNQTAWASAFP